LIELLVERFEQGFFEFDGDWHVIFDGIQASQDEIKDADLENKDPLWSLISYQKKNDGFQMDDVRLATARHLVLWSPR
jgi:hypothetical protein